MIALLGFGKTHQALLEYLNSQGESCIVYDDKFSHQSTDERGNLFSPSSLVLQSSLQIPSPGIPPYHPMIKNSTNLLSEYDYILPSLHGLQIWISGTNGKTTTTEMLEWILKDFGGVSGGNIGTPLASLIKLDPKILILETSSFSLHYTQRAYPHCYILLPLKQDHIQWHGSFEAYVNDKLSVLPRMRDNSVAFIPKDLQDHKSVKSFVGKLYLYEDSKHLAGEFGIDIARIAYKEPFLLDFVLALCGAKVMCGECRLEALQDYRVGEHKMEELVDHRGRLWVNDSKGTNADASIWAIRNYKDKKIYLILGGEDKGADLSELFEEMRGRDIEIFAIGKNALKLQSLAQRYHIPCRLSHTLPKAVEYIHMLHTQESVALLSPAAASLDQYASYKHRGEEFKNLIKSLCQNQNFLI